MKSELKTAIRERWEKNDAVYDHVEAHGVKDPQQIQKWQNILTRLGTEPLSVLDVGTGTGFLACLLFEKGHCVTGIDWSAAMLSKAITKAKAKGYQISFLQGDIECLPFSAGTFDAVTARHVLWTLTDPEKTLREWARVLKPDGWVMADITQRSPEEEDHHYPAEIGSRLPLNKNTGPEEIKSLFSGAGLVDIHIEDISIEGSRRAANYLLTGRKPGRTGCKPGGSRGKAENGQTGSKVCSEA